MKMKNRLYWILIVLAASTAAVDRWRKRQPSLTLQP